VRQAIVGALPPRRRYSPRAKPKLGAVADFIDKVLDANCQAPRKQRHTARRAVTSPERIVAARVGESRKIPITPGFCPA
jgi:hypothetical protein